MKWKKIVDFIVPAVIIVIVVVAMFKIGGISITTDSSKIPTATGKPTNTNIIKPYIIDSHEGCIQVAIKVKIGYQYYYKNYYTGDKSACPGFSYLFLPIEDIVNKIRLFDNQ